MSYLNDVTTRKTASSEPVPGRDDQVKNSAAGYVFKADAWVRFDRFLIMGSEGGTFYVTERKLTLDNYAVVCACIAKEGERAVKRIVEVSEAGRAKSNDPALFALAIAASAPDLATRQLALEALPKVARIGTHLFHFMEYVKQFRGRGRSLMGALRAWYEDMDVDRLALQAVKYKQRDGWSHRDVLRLCKAKPDDPARNAVFRFMAGKATMEDLEAGPPMLAASVRAQSGELDLDEISALRVPREALPTEVLDRPEVWRAMLPTMPMGALVRNLGKLTSVGVIKPLDAATSMVAERLCDPESVQKSRIHPIAVLAALETYSSGHGFRGSLTWSPAAEVINGLDAALELSFGNVEPTGLRSLVALDVSGSMGHPVLGMEMVSCRVAAAAMASILIRTEPMTHTVGFTAGPGVGRGLMRNAALTELGFTKRSTIKEMVAKVTSIPFGGTNCALPMLYAMEHGLEVDAFHIFTDNEHWAGGIHPFQALKQYREKSGINAKLVCWALASNEFSIADPTDPGMLDVCGLDAGAPNVVNEWLKS
jgi:60 kDa SS-A/Ro ribonucleoprotein